jgi:hypothetical protein
MTSYLVQWTIGATVALTVSCVFWVKFVAPSVATLLTIFR